MLYKDVDALWKILLCYIYKPKSIVLYVMDLYVLFGFGNVYDFDYTVLSEI